MRTPFNTVAHLVMMAGIAGVAVLAGCQNTEHRMDEDNGGWIGDTAPGQDNRSPGRGWGQLETVHEFYGPIPTGVAVSREGRVFVNYPRWEDPVEYTVAEITGGTPRPFPDADMNRGGKNNPEGLFSVQSVVVDAKNRLWAVDTGSVDMGRVENMELPKLVCIDLATNRVVQTIHFPGNVITHQSYLNDVRFDLTRGQAGYAFITDSSAQGSNGIVVVDLASGRSWRKLNDHPSTKAEKGVELRVEGRPLMIDKPDQPPQPLTVGSDGIAIEPPGTQGQRLFYCPLAGHALYSVTVDALVDPNLSDQEVAKTIRREDRDFASDGLECDRRGRLFLTDFEHNAIRVREHEGSFSTLVSGPQMLWPDSMAIGPGGDLYFTANQLHRQAKFNDGQDRRQPPYYLYRVRGVAAPVVQGGGGGRM